MPELTSSDKPMAMGKETGGLKRKLNEAPKAAPIKKPIDNLKVCGKVTIGERKFCMVVSLMFGFKVIKTLYSCMFCRFVKNVLS